jgi:hypothetical protein
MAHTDAHGAVNHETRDVDLRRAPHFVAAMTVFLAIVFAFVWFVYARWRSDAVATQQPVPAIAARDGDRLPPLPRLQTTPGTDLQAFQKSEEQVLNTYAWVDREKGVVRIPVSRAIELVAERGLPAPIPAPAGTTAAPATPPSTPAQ